MRPGPGDAHFAQSRPAKHEYAVMYQGEYETPWDGTAVAVRAHARALDQAGIPVLLKSFSGVVVDQYGTAIPVHTAGMPAQVEAEVGHLAQNTASAFFPVVKHAVVQDAEHLKRIIVPRGAIARGGYEEEVSLRAHIYASTILYSVWERDRVDPGIVKILNRLSQCWVPCHDNQRMLETSGVTAGKVFVVPHPYDSSTEVLKLRRRQADTEWRKFYSIGRWEPRKGYAELIEAFLSAFTPRDKVVLTIKYTGGTWEGYPSPTEALERVRTLPHVIANRWTPERITERVQLREGRFPRPQILRMHYYNNIYVAPSHGEAWCLPAFEASLAGNALVYTPTGGIMDFAAPTDIPITLTDSVPVPRSYNWESDARWAGYDLSSLVAALQRASAPRSHQGQDLSRFSSEAIGALMRERVLASAVKYAPAALSYYEKIQP